MPRFRPDASHLLRLLIFAIAPLVTVNAQTRPELDTASEPLLSTDQTAELLGVGPSLRSLLDPARSTDLLRLAAQQQIVASVTAASLNVDATAGQIDEEIAEARELRDFLVARRQHAIDLLNLISFGIGGTLGTASSALGLTPHTQASGVLGIVSGSSITGLSALGLKLGPGGKMVLEAHSNMLCYVFGLQAEPNNYYPQLVASFMSKPAPGETQDRKQHLIHAWIKLGRLPDPQTEKGKLKVERLASVPQQNTKLTIGDLEDREAMLYDLRARVMYLKRDLAQLMSSTAKLP